MSIHSKFVKQIIPHDDHNTATYIFSDGSSATFVSPQYIEAHTDVLTRVPSQPKFSGAIYTHNKTLVRLGTI